MLAASMLSGRYLMEAACDASVCFIAAHLRSDPATIDTAIYRIWLQESAGDCAISTTVFCAVEPWTDVSADMTDGIACYLPAVPVMAWNSPLYEDVIFLHAGG